MWRGAYDFWVYRYRYGNGPRIGQSGVYIIAEIPAIPQAELIPCVPHYKYLSDMLWAEFWDRGEKTVPVERSYQIARELDAAHRAEKFAEVLTK